MGEKVDGWVDWGAGHIGRQVNEREVRWSDKWMGEWEKLPVRIKRSAYISPERQSCHMWFHTEAPDRKGLCVSLGQCKTRPGSGTAVPWT